MTRQMADDEVLRVLAKEIRRCAGNNNAKYHLTWADRIDAAVTALQAERDALRADLHDWSGRALREQTAHHEAVKRAERAESALEALRGQVEGLVAACEELDAAERAWDEAPGSVQGLGDTDGRDCDGPEYQRLVRAINARDAALLAIKERMG